MGWLDQEHPSRHGLTIETWIKRQFNHTHSDGTVVTVLASCGTGTGDQYAQYVALQVSPPEGPTRVSCLVLGMTFTKGRMCWKDVMETSGPVWRQCPEKILNMLTPLPEESETSNGVQWAREWREACWKNVQQRKQQRKLCKQLQAGDTLQFSTVTFDGEKEAVVVDLASNLFKLKNRSSPVLLRGWKKHAFTVIQAS